MQIPTGPAGTRQTLEIMRRLVLSGKKSPMVRQAAVALTQGLPQKDTYREIVHLHAFVRDRIRYVRDIRGVETLHTAERVLLNKQGDCDDKSILLASLLESLGHSTRFVAIGFRPNQYSHVYPEVFDRGEWLTLETTEPVDVGWQPSNVLIRLVVNNAPGPVKEALSSLAGKRVRRFMAAQAATVQAAVSAAAAQPNDTAAQERAQQLLEQQQASQASFAAKEATKKHGLVAKLKAVRLRVDPVAKVQAAVRLARKVGISGAIKQEKINLKKEHLKATKLMAATGSPSFKKHARFEENKYKRTELKSQLAQIEAQRAVHDTPLLQEQEAAVVAQLTRINQQDKQYLKEGKLAVLIASIVVGFFTFGGGSVAIQGAFQALKEGAVEIAKKILLAAVAAGLKKGGSKKDAQKATEAANALAQYPPDPNLPSLDAMIQDSQTKQKDAQAQTLGWLVPAGIFIFSMLS